MKGETTLSVPLKRFKQNKNYAKKWLALGDIAHDLGLVWAGEHKSRDIFHFEWHPGYGGYIKRKELERFLAAAGPAGVHYQRAWKLFPHPALSERDPDEPVAEQVGQEADYDDQDFEDDEEEDDQ